MFSFRKGLTLEELLNNESCDFQAGDVYIDPPVLNVLTDEDSNVGNFDHLSVNQLLTGAEVHLFDLNLPDNNNDNNQSDVRNSDSEFLKQDQSNNNDDELLIFRSLKIAISLNSTLKIFMCVSLNKIY